MRQAILALSLGNVSNACYMNSALLAELWACCMDDTFAWPEVGPWKEPLIRLLANSNTHQILQDEHCLDQFLKSWHTSHEMEKQQDSAEFVGVLRYAMHGASKESGKPVFKWEARLEATTEDVDSLFAPVLLQQTKDVDCTLQDLINLWHEQVLFHCDFFRLNHDRLLANESVPNPRSQDSPAIYLAGFILRLGSFAVTRLL